MKLTVLDVPIANLWTTKIVFKYPTEKVWNAAGISLKKRIERDAALEARVLKVLDPDNLKKYVVGVDATAPTRCIDGRMTLGWDKFSIQQKRALGPKIAGGTAHAALAHRIVDVMDIEKDLMFEDDIRYVVEQYQAINIGFGGHVDTRAKGWDTGCGAVDNINKILEKLQRPEPQEQLRDLAQIILGDAFDARSIVNEVIGRMLYLDALKPTYMPKKDNDPGGEFLYKKTVVDLLRKAAKTNAEVVPQLAGEHCEVAIVLNSVKDMTIDTDRFAADNGGDIQVFGWDVWEMYEEARRLYPYRMTDSVDEQRNAVEKRVKHITTRALLGIASAMVLTDGSLRVVVVA